MTLATTPIRSSFLMSDDVLTPEQMNVVELRDGKVVVTAAAGSGKTRVLTHRYVAHIVEDGLRPDQILTITFTQKAAASMKTRIVNELTKIGRFADAQAAETGPIQTIHSFCQRMLRENALAAGLDPDFEIASANEAVLSDAIWQAIGEADEDELAREYVKQVAGTARYGGPTHSLLQSLVEKVLDELRSSGWMPGDVETRFQSPDAVRRLWEAALIEDAPELVLHHLPDTAAPIAERLASAYKAAKVAKPPYLVTSESADAEASQHTAGLMLIVTRAWRLLEAEMLKSQELDFTALEALAVRLLKDSPATRARLRRQFKVLLVDEAQDVNPTQYQLLDGMGIDVEMFVGDAQQSIYGFRQADVALFRNRAETIGSLQLSQNFRSAPGILRFVDELFRAQWGDAYRAMHREGDVIDFEEVTQRRFDGVEFWLQTTFDSERVADHVRDLLAEPEVKRKDICILTQTGASAGKILESLEGRKIPARLSGGAARYYTRMEVRDVANALQALSDPTDSYALLATLRGPCVQLSLDGMILLGVQENLYEALKMTHLPTVEDRAKVEAFLAWFDPLTSYADRLSAWEAISEIFGSSPILANLASRRSGRQRVANVRKLLSLAAQQPDLSPREFATRVREIQRLSHKEGDAPADDEKEDLVTIMTVHKAKGLEWPIVILADTFKDLVNDSKDLYDVAVEGRTGIVATASGAARAMPYRWLQYKKRQRETEERWRVLYVALTRAEKRLCICVNPGGHGDKFSNKIPKLIGFKRDNPPPGIRVRVDEEL